MRRRAPAAAEEERERGARRVRVRVWERKRAIFVDGWVVDVDDDDDDGLRNRIPKR